MDQILRPNSPPLLFPTPPWTFQGSVARKLLETAEGRARFLARYGAALGVAFVVAILALEVPKVVLGVCQ